jgi:hypothetical protein
MARRLAFGAVGLRAENRRKQRPLVCRCPSLGDDYATSMNTQDEPFQVLPFGKLERNRVIRGLP